MGSSTRCTPRGARSSGSGTSLRPVVYRSLYGQDSHALRSGTTTQDGKEDATPNTYDEAVEAAEVFATQRGQQIATEIVAKYGLPYYPATAELIYEGLSTDNKLITSLLPTASEVDHDDDDLELDVPAYELLDKKPLYDVYVDAMREGCRSYLLQLTNIIRKGSVNGR